MLQRSRTPLKKEVKKEAVPEIRGVHNELIGANVAINFECLPGTVNFSQKNANPG